MPLELRGYQKKTLKSLFDWLENNQGNPCVVLPTGSGKSLCIAGFIEETLALWPDTKILVLTHQKELVMQDAKALNRLLPSVPIGIYSAALKSKELDMPVTFASIQSIYKKRGPHWNVILVDEAHLINNEDTGMYRSFLSSCHSRVIGWTATPYRLGQGYLTDENGLFSGLISEVSILDLQNMGYLSKIRSKGTFSKMDLSELHLRGGEFVESEMQEKLDTYETNEAIADEIVKSAAFYDRHHILVFCAGVEHARHMAEILREKGMAAEDVNGQMSQETRDEILYRFTQGTITALTNTLLLTTGFDYPDIDMIAMLRPTMSPGLYLQEAGRGLRLKSNGGDCLLLDFAGNVERHGPVAYVQPPRKKGEGKNGVAPCKECPECLEIVPASTRECPVCGHVFPKNDMTWVLFGGDVNGDGPSAYRVIGWTWQIVESRTSHREQIRCTYSIIGNARPSKYYLVWHEGWAGQKGRTELTALMRRLGVVWSPDDDWNDIVGKIADKKAPEYIVTRRNRKNPKYEDIVTELYEDDVERLEKEAEKAREKADEHRKRILGL